MTEYDAGERVSPYLDLADLHEALAIVEFEKRTVFCASSDEEHVRELVAGAPGITVQVHPYMAAGSIAIHAARPFTEVTCDACGGKGQRMQRMSDRCGIVHPCGICAGTGKKRVYSEGFPA